MNILMLKWKILIIWKVLRGSLLVLLIILVVFISYSIINKNRIKVELDSCVDGDTAWFIIDGKRTKVRFLGIDTPESTTKIEDYGVDAGDYTCNSLINANDIYIELDSNSEKYDKYNRLLGYVFVDNNNLNELLLSNGLAEVKYVYADYKYIDRFCQIQYNAYKDKLGIWNSYDYTKNYCYLHKNG